MKVITLQIFVDEVDADEIEQDLKDWYYGADWGMQHIIINSDRIAPSQWDDDTRSPREFDTTIPCEFETKQVTQVELNRKEG